MKTIAFLALSVNAQCNGDETIQDSSAVVCTSDAMIVTIGGCAIENLGNLDINAAMLGNDASEDCKAAFDADANEYMFNSNIGTCNTQVIKDDVNGTLIYSNFVHAEEGLAMGPITRVRSMNIDFSCEFDLAHTLSLANGFSPSLSNFEVSMPTQSGSFSVEMGVFTDNSFATAVDGALEIQVPEPIHIQVHSEDMTVQLKECWATPSADPADSTRYAFIESYCGDDDEINTYETLTIHQNGASGSGQFSIDSFKFIASDASVEMFIHCDVTLCDPSAEDCSVCAASGSRRKRRSTDTTTTGTIGPVIIK